MGDWTGLAVALVSYAIVLFGIGFTTIKFTWWGGCATLCLWAGAPLTSAFTRGEILAEMLPHFSEILLFYPKTVVPTGLATFDTHVGGFLGAGIAVLLLVFGVFPYAAGLFLGLTAWPELILLRLVI